MKASPIRYAAAVVAGAAALLAGCGDDETPQRDLNVLPARITNLVGPVTYDGVNDDLLTAGLGKTGLGGAAPGFADPLNPTVAELRRRAIYTAYRGIIDFTAAGGYGTLYGPNIDINGNNTLGEGKIAGKEILAYADDGTGKKNVTVMVQIPASFDKDNACIVTGPSSGSRGVYGGIGTAGDWGLKHGCAVAYTDAGKGVGYQDLQADKVNLIDGRLVTRASAGTAASFASDLTGTALSAFNAAFPNRFAYKQLYSQQNPEKDWGQNVLDSVRLAFWALNEQYGEIDIGTGKRLRTIKPDNTIVIASSVSNGGAESLQALEQDTEGLIDGLAVGEPNAQPNDMTGVTVNLNGAAIPVAGKPLIDIFTYKLIYELCASISTQAQAPNGIRPGWFGFGTAPLGSALTQVSGVELQTIATARCQSLADKGLVTGSATAQQADAALAKLQAYGWNDPLHNALFASHYRLADPYIVLYVMAYGKFSVSDNVCGFSLANISATGDVAAQVPAVQASIFSTSNGLNTGGDLIYNDAVGGARQFHIAVSPSTGRMDGALDGFLCARNLVTGVDAVTGAPLTGTMLANSQRVQAGIRDVLLTGNLRGKPAVLVHGRSDTLVPVNHASRAYAAFNSKVEPGNGLRYYEVENGQHFDVFLPNAASGGVQGYDALLVPVHYYFMNAMDLMWARLKNSVPLPASQVVRTIPRGGAAGSAPAITTANVPKISATPASGNTISIGAGVINVPNLTGTCIARRMPRFAGAFSFFGNAMITLHYYPSNASLAPHVLLEELGVPYELALVDRKNDAHKSPEYLKLNPNGSIPVLVDGDLVLYESAAICLYLADMHPQAQLVPALRTPERAHFYKWLIWGTNTLQAMLIHYFYGERMVDEGDTAAAARIKARAEAKIGPMLDQVDAQLASHGAPWLLGPAYSAVDAYTLMLCRWTRNFARPARSLPHLGPYLLRMLARPAVQRAFTTEKLPQPLI